MLFLLGFINFHVVPKDAQWEEIQHLSLWGRDIISVIKSL